MIDFHSHIIPKIDDGSKDMDMTIAMLTEEDAQGVTVAVATPHFYAHKTSIPQFLEKRQRCLEEMYAAMEKDSSGTRFPDIMVGAEVYYFQDMGKAEKLLDLCIEGTNVILLEMPFVQWTDRVYNDIKQMIEERGLKVVLAHIERYPQFQKNKDIWDKVMRLPLVTQLNAGSFQKGWRKRRFCLEWVSVERSDRPLSILGSDCHDLTSRPPNTRAAREIIGKKVGEVIIERMNDKAAELLGI